MSGGLGAVTLTAADLDAALRFYDAALGALGWERVTELVDEEEDDAPVEAVAWGLPGAAAAVWVVTATERSRPTTGMHLRLGAPDPATVTAFHAAGIAAGGRGHSAPRRWTLYRRGEFGATLADPDGNLVEAVAPE